MRLMIFCKLTRSMPERRAASEGMSSRRSRRGGMDTVSTCRR